MLYETKSQGRNQMSFDFLWSIGPPASPRTQPSRIISTTDFCSEQRRTRRVDLILQVNCKVSGFHSLGWSHDISEGGHVSIN